MFRSFRYFLAITIILSSSVGYAEPEGISRGEVALLPTYCADKNFGFNTPDAERRAYWASLFGKSWDGLHHYCWGLVGVRRAMQAGVPPVRKAGYLREALADYIYVVQNSDPQFVLLPEVYLRIGEAQLLLGQSGSALESFQMSRSLKPDYWPAYSKAAEALISMRMPAKARELLAEGLVQAPDSVQLRELFKKLGGDTSKMSRPRPVTAEPSPPSAASSSPADTVAPAASGS